MRHTPLLALALLAACSGAPKAATRAPEAAATPAVARVMDAAHLLTPEQAKAITAQSASLERRTRHQFVVVTVPSLSGHDITQYSMALGNRLGVGRKDINDGVLLVVAPREREVRIAVGDGLRRQLTDAEAKAIVEQTMIPSFKARHFGDGIVKGADRIISELSETSA